MKKKILCFCFLFFGFWSLEPAFADVYWTDWVSATKGNLGSADGIITDDSLNTIAVTFSGEILFAQTSDGTNYWKPSDGYISSVVSNAPPKSDIIALSGGIGATYTISFSEPVKNPVIAVVSLGADNTSATYEFDSSFFILSSGEGYNGDGSLETIPFDILKGNEGNGVIQFVGTFSSISWTVPGSEPFGWSAFTVGVPSDSSSINHSPDKPILSSPSNYSGNVSLTQTFRTNGFSDPDTGDKHLRTEWQISTSNEFLTSIFFENSLVHLTSLPIPELLLEENTLYFWRVRFYDNHSYASEWSDTFYFRTENTQNDLDGNGIPDILENTTVDLDNDGVSDFQQTDIKSLDTKVGNGQMGVSIKNSTSIVEITGINSIDPESISAHAVPQNMPLGLFALRISVSNPGDVANVTIYFSEAAEPNAIWYRYDSINGWVDYSEHATFSQDRKSVNLELKDGDYGDSDGIANGVIVDPSGFGIASWVKGFVSDSLTNEKITNATVTFEDLDLNLNTLLDGNYLSMILPGTYDFSVSAPGYISQTVSSLEIIESQVVTRNIELSARVQMNGLEKTGTPSTIFPTTYKMNVESGSEIINYHYSIHSGYGTSDYDNLNWQSMTDTEWVSDSSLDYTFPGSGKFLVVTWATSSDTNSVDSNGIPIMGWSVDTSRSGCMTNFSGLTISGKQKVNEKMTFTVNAENSCGNSNYYRFSMHPYYGTDGYDGTQWQSMTSTEWISTNSMNYTFTEAGKYIIVVWVTSDTSNVIPEGIPIIGWSVDIE